MVQPGISLAGPVAVVGELALAAAMEPLLSFEAGVADYVCQAVIPSLLLERKD